MLNKDSIRELAYVVKINNIIPIIGSDNCEAAVIGGWQVMVRKGIFKEGDLAVYFEIDSHVDTNKPEFNFLASKKGNVKTQRYTFGGKGSFTSQGLLMSFGDFGWAADKYTEGTFLTEKLEVTHIAEGEDNQKRAMHPADKYKSMAQHYPKIFKLSLVRKLMKSSFGKKLLYVFFGHYKKSKDSGKGWPSGRFPGVSKTDQDRCENLIGIIDKKGPYIRTQKCDGSSGTYILERKGKNKFEFYVCSRNVRMFNPDQESFYSEKNYYWEVAEKYQIKEKMMKMMEEDDGLKFTCWQGEICAPGIQKNPQGLTETHFYCFHMTDNIVGRYDIRQAAAYWKQMGMEVVPIDEETYDIPEDFAEFKKTADGFYDASVCEGKTNCPREGYVYYSLEDPNFSFKNVSNEYLISRHQ